MILPGLPYIPTYWDLPVENPVYGGLIPAGKMAFDYIPVWSSKRAG